MTMLLALILTGATVQSWQHFSHFGSMSDIALSGTTVIAATSGGVAFGTLDGTWITWDSVWTYPGELSDSDCRAILLDQGPPLRYWVGTWGGGIDIYTPGEGWQHLGQLEGLPVSEEINAISLSDSAVFAGTSQGLAIKQYGYFQVWTELSTGGGLPADNVTCLQTCDSGLYAGTDQGLTLLAAGGYPGSADSWLRDSLLEGRSIRDLRFSGDTLFVATDDGLWFAAPGSPFEKETGYTGTSPLCIATSGDNIAAGESTAVEIRLGGVWQHWPTYTGQLSRDVEFGGDSVMLVGTANIQSTGDCGVGLTRGWGGAWSTSYPSGLTDNRVRSISLGPSGECWASTERAGLDVYSQGAWTAFHDIFPSEYQMFSVAGLPGGGVFVSHYHSGVTYLDWNGTPETSDDYHFTLDKGNSGLLNDQVVSMSVGADGTVWFGQEPYWESESEPSGVTRLRWTEGEISSATWVSWSGASGLPSGRVAAVADAGGGTAWVGTAEGLVEVGPGPGDVSEVIGVGQGLPSADVRSVALGRDGRLFAGTTAGLSRVDPENMSASSVEGVEGTISSLCFDHLGAVWAAGTATNALYRIDPDGSVEVYNTYNSPLLSTLVYGIAEDANEGLLYVACDHGIWQLDLGSGLSEGSGAVLFPNPFVPGRGDVLGVAGLPDLPTTLRVFDLNGRLVYESSFPDRDGIAWDGGGSDGSPVSSGIYVVEVGQSGATELLKLAVVR